MTNYKIIAGKIERFDNADYIKARIYLEIEDLDIDHDLYVNEAYKWWLNSDNMSPEDLGMAIWNGLSMTSETDPEAVILAGIDIVRY